MNSEKWRYIQILGHVGILVVAGRNIIAIWLRYENMIAIYRWLGSKYCLWNNINDGEYLFMSAEMSDLVKIRFFYGPGRVQICETGADLSEFAYSTKIPGRYFGSLHT